MTDSNPSASNPLSQLPSLQERITPLITSSIDRLRHLNQSSIQSQWRFYLGELPIAAATHSNIGNWQPVSLNDRQHVAWAKGQQVLWLGQRLVIPSHLQGYAIDGMVLRLSLTWWAENAQVFVNGVRVQEGDLFDHSARILLSEAARSGAAIDVAIRLVSPGHDDGALVRSICLYELSDQSIDPCPEPGFVADELAVLHSYSTTFMPEKLTVLAEAIEGIDWGKVGDRAAFQAALGAVRQQLLPFSDWIKQRKIQLLGHAHLDLAWLWTVADTWEAAERTFKSVLQLQQAFPDLTFCHSTPALYAWVEANRPELFAAIQAKIAAGTWEVVAGLWVEPELNLVSGESIVRQVLYGQRYVQEKFGELNQIAWLPDSFGFCWQLPQILQQGGVQYFVTQKLRWNDTTQFPYDLFWWQSPDGSKVLSFNSAPIGEGIDPVKMAQYACGWEAKTGVTTALWLPGVGDHGGGPTRDMLEVANRWQQSPFFPQLEFTTALKFLQSLSDSCVLPPPLPNAQELPNPSQSYHRGEFRKPDHSSFKPDLDAQDSLPTWNNELYLEFHRGCYTTHADQKQYNRHCGRLLYEAELFASIATLTTAASYPQLELETAWKQVLFNQFHDILPGSAIPEVYEDADRAWKEAATISQRIVLTALKSIASRISLPTPPHPEAKAIVVFNSLNWERSCRLQIILAQPESSNSNGHWQICDLEGQPVAYQHCPPAKPTKPHRYVYFLAENIPALGYRTFWLIPSSPASPASPAPSASACSYTLENEFLRVTVDSTTGDLSSVFDKANQREVLSGAGNQLQAFRDAGQYWDAWNIDPNYAQHPLPPSELLNIEPGQGWDTFAQSCIQIKRKVSKTIVWQKYMLQQGSPILKIKTSIRPNEEHILIKAAFSFNLEADRATYEIPFGAIQRTTRPQSDREKAQWEVPALNWADLSDRDYGVSLLSDCKHGYDAQPNQLRLTLFRRPTFPNPQADLSPPGFTYALYPHAGGWQAAQTVQQGYEFNQPMTAHRIVKLDPKTQADNEENPLPPVGQFLKLDANNLVLSAFKRSEDQPHQWILRCYECQGRSASLSWKAGLGLLENYLDLNSLQRVDLLERPVQQVGQHESPKDKETEPIAPWKIVTLQLKESVLD